MGPGGFALLVASTDLRPPRGLPARSPSAPRASLGASSRSPARPRRPRGGLQSVGGVCVLPGPAATHWHRCSSLRRPPLRRRLSLIDGSVPCLAARPGSAGFSSPQLGLAFTPQASCPALAHIAAESTPNVARNSPATLSNIEFRSLELQRFQTLLKLHPIELRARFRGSCSCWSSNFACNSLECVSWFEV